MILTYRQKLRPSRAQHRLLDDRLERQRLLYNAALQERRDAWRLQRKPITRFDQQKSLTINREILDAAWRRLIELIRYKAVRAGGGTMLRDARRSSGECSGCGAYAAKPLSLRWHSCACGAEMHRDENAARVMLARGHAAIAPTGEAVPPGTPTWAGTPCVVPEPSPLPIGSAGDETSDGVSNPK